MLCFVEFKQWKQPYSLSCPWYIHFVLWLTLHCWRLNYTVLYGHWWKLRKSLRNVRACRGAGWVVDQQVVAGFYHLWSVHLALMLMKKAQNKVIVMTLKTSVDWHNWFYKLFVEYHTTHPVLIWMVHFVASLAERTVQ